MQKNSGIGGQAIMEGIMMRNGEKYSIAVRRPDGGIESVIRPYKSICPIKGIMKIPILRGAVSFIDSMVVGVSSLMWSAEFAGEDEETDRETGTQKTKEEKEKEDRSFKWILTGTVIFAVGFSVVLFMLLPFWLAGFLRRFGASDVVINLTEAVLRLVIFLGYMLLISRMEDIQRVFSYHGAEHKCINCIEHGLPLSVENVMKSSRQHKRCGTSFLLIVISISIVAFLILGLFGIRRGWMRFLMRLVLIPVIAGVSFELLRFCGCHEGPVVDLLVKPGLALQRLVTREPDEKMCEVAITAIEEVFDWREWQKQ
ncbi:MAG: DUF1385 domain-containing protein [Lachnospiraceae bacterium]|nr:DUF1385 domain-containing protein [Lachnospiraceae bacterium]